MDVKKRFDAVAVGALLTYLGVRMMDKELFTFYASVFLIYWGYRLLMDNFNFVSFEKKDKIAITIFAVWGFFILAKLSREDLFLIGIVLSAYWGYRLITNDIHFRLFSKSEESISLSDRLSLYITAVILVYVLTVSISRNEYLLITLPSVVYWGYRFVLNDISFIPKISAINFKDKAMLMLFVAMWSLFIFASFSNRAEVEVGSIIIIFYIYLIFRFLLKDFMEMLGNSINSKKTKDI